MKKAQGEKRKRNHGKKNGKKKGGGYDNQKKNIPHRI